MRHLEDNLQKECVNWFWLAYPNIYIHHSPNGGKRNAREAARFKKMGTMAGYPDLHIVHQSRGYGGLFIELKSPKGVLTDAQMAFMEYAIEKNYRYMVCRSSKEFEQAVNNYLE